MPASIRLDKAKSAPDWLMPDPLWEEVRGLLPPEKSRSHGTPGGRPLADPRRTMDAIFYVLRTGSQWKALPRSLGSGSTAHRYFQKWTATDVFEQLWRLGLDEYDTLKGIKWTWQAADGVMTKTPLAARRLARNPPTRSNAA